MDTQHRVLVALGATAGAVAVCMLAHKVWVIRQQDDTLQVCTEARVESSHNSSATCTFHSATDLCVSCVLQVVSSNSSSSSWMPQALLQGAAALSSSARPRHQQQQLSPGGCCRVRAVAVLSWQSYSCSLMMLDLPSSQHAGLSHAFPIAAHAPPVCS